jgi:uncharacterized lipoprotein YmbA
VKRCAVLIAALLLAGCGSSPKSRFYTLGSSEPPAKIGAPAYIVTVGPVTVPDSVDRPQMVLRLSTTEVTLAEQARWAEPLKSSIPRVIAANLAHDLDSARVAVYGKGVWEDADYRVMVDIERFDATPGDAIVIEASWKVRRTKHTEGWTGRSVLRESAPGRDVDAMVGAYTRALASLSADIAQVIRSSAK